MSFLDLGTLTMHRCTEMEGRINTFDEKCDRAINDIKKLKMQAHTFVSQLNCEPAELKDRFLRFMKKLDEYSYLITDFNLALGQLDDINNSEYTPVQDCSALSLAPSFMFNTNNLMDALSEPTPSKSCACSNQCPPDKPKRIKIPKDDRLLIAFSSSSSSSEIMPCRKSEMVAKEVQCSLVEEMGAVNLKEASPSPPSTPEPCNLPAQTILEVDHKYPGIITSISGCCFWVIITEDNRELWNFMHDITKYYNENRTPLTTEQARLLTYCAYYDEETKFYYRALYIKEDEDAPEKASLFLVDTGELRSAAAECVQPLAPRFCERPPYARYCHLAGVELMSYSDKAFMKKFETFMTEFLNVSYTFQVDDNSSESIGVYVILPENKILNDIIVQQGLAVLIDKEPSKDEVVPAASPAVVYCPPEMVDSDTDITQCPEYDDPVEAVTGYHNRDEADICKHYKGGPEKTCFKGNRCTKKHVVKHPEGWTLDRVEVTAKCKSVPLPAPGSWHKVLVTHVCHFDRVYVNFINENEAKDEIPEFGVVLPPTTLEGLTRDMNSAAARATYKRLQLAPAPGEMVAALYPPDGLWYRARVLTVTRYDQSVEVMYVDYGTTVWVKEDQVRELEPRLAALPTQAVRCVLAGVHVASHSSQDWARVKRALTDLLQDKEAHCHVIARDYDEITVELLDLDEYNVVERLAAMNLIQIKEYSICDDSNITQRVVVP